MSTEGNANNYIELRGSLSLPEAIHGKSAYEIAVMNGFDGTEEEWLYSLAEEANTIAKAYADNAGASAQRAEEAKAAAETAETNAQGSAESATESASAASASAERAETAAVRAETAAEEAETHANSASASAQNAAESEGKALMYHADSSMSARNAEYYAQAAESAKKTAETAATNAANSASEASGYAWGAKTEANRAEAAVAAMGNGAEVATAKAAEASTSAQNASASAQTAQTNASTATTAANTATAKAAEASAYASSAKSSADRADAAAATASNEVNPRAMFRQLAWYDKTKKKHIYFEDVFASNATSSGWSYTVYALEAHGTASTTQDVYVSRDGGETWEVLHSLTIDATNGVWYTDIFVDNNRTGNDTLYLLKTNSGFLNNNYQLHTLAWNGQSFYSTGTLELGARRWLGNCNSIDIGVNAAWTERAVIFGEYQTTTDGTTYSLWKTKNNGKNWYKVLEIQGDKNGATGTGDIRHWHTVQFDNYTKHWWATSGDAGNQCRIYRSTDHGETWEIIFSGTQRERTCGFVFEKDCIYYAMDSTRADRETDTKIFKIDKSKLDTDRDNCREEVATVDSGYAVYGLSRTEYPRGFIVWSQFEPGASVTKDRYILQFYDYGTKKLYPIARIGTSDIEKNQYIGFYAGSRMQNVYSGVVFAKPTYSLQNGLLGNGNISTHVKVNITC